VKDVRPLCTRVSAADVIREPLKSSNEPFLGLPFVHNPTLSVRCIGVNSCHAEVSGIGNFVKPPGKPFFWLIFQPPSARRRLGLNTLMIFEMRGAKNGYILKASWTAEKTGDAEEVVFQEKYDDEYGPSTSRYSPKRTYVRVEPGDKYENPKGGLLRSSKPRE